MTTTVVSIVAALLTAFAVAFTLVKFRDRRNDQTSERPDRRELLFAVALGALLILFLVTRIADRNNTWAGVCGAMAIAVGGITGRNLAARRT